jgi:hypothetical protein
MMSGIENNLQRTPPHPHPTATPSHSSLLPSLPLSTTLFIPVFCCDHAKRGVLIESNSRCMGVADAGRYQVGKPRCR